MMSKDSSLKRFTFALLAAVLVAAVFLVPGPAFAEEGVRLAVTTPALNVRSGPGTNYQVINLLRAGDQVAVVGRHSASGWWQIKLSNGTMGWVTGAQDLVKVSGDTKGVPEVAAPAAPAAAPRVTSPGRSLIAFQVASGGPIYLVNPDGTGLRQLTTGIDPALSPDGRQVAFTRWQASTDGSFGKLMVINVDGTGERVLHDGALQPKSPAWSPDGARIAINMQQGGTLSPVRTCGLAMPPSDAYDIHIDYDDQGNIVQICFTVPANPGWGLRLVNTQTGAYDDLPRDIHSFSPAWDMANPWHIIFRGDGGLKSLDVNRNATWQATSDNSDRSPAISPDGKRIAVNYYQNDHWEIHVMNPDGSGRVRLTETPLTLLINHKPAWNNVSPAWSPDGKQILFLSDRNGLWELFLMNADGSSQRPLLSNAQSKALNIQYHFVDERVASWR